MRYTCANAPPSTLLPAVSPAFPLPPAHPSAVPLSKRAKRGLFTHCQKLAHIAWKACWSFHCCLFNDRGCFTRALPLRQRGKKKSRNKKERKRRPNAIGRPHARYQGRRCSQHGDTAREGRASDLAPHPPAPAAHAARAK